MSKPEPKTFDEFIALIRDDLCKEIELYKRLVREPRSLLVERQQRQLDAVLATAEPILSIVRSMTPPLAESIAAYAGLRIGSVEMAHSIEDWLYGAVIAAIAEGRCTDPAECCRIALKTKSMDIARYYS